MARGMGVLLALVAVCAAGSDPRPQFRSLSAPYGTTPRVDGIITPSEWADATYFTGVMDWVPEFQPVSRPVDLSLDDGWVKHDDTHLYFAFNISGAVLDRVGMLARPSCRPPA